MMMTTMTYRASVALAALTLLCPAVALSQKAEQDEISQGASDRRTIERSTTTDPNRPGGRRTDYRYDEQRPGELYVAGFGGYTLGHSFSNIQGTGGNPQYLGDISTNLADSAVYGAKVGYYLPGRLNWLGFEVEGFSTTPHLKQSGIGPGNHLRVTTLAFNVVHRGKYWCTSEERTHGQTTRTGAGGTRMVQEELCRLQPYAGIGLGLFFADLDGGLTGGRSVTENAVPGFNGLVGVRYFFNEHLALFTEYKYTRASFKFDDATAAGAGMRGDWHASHFVGGVSLHF